MAIEVTAKELENALVTIEMAIRRYWLDNNEQGLAAFVRRLEQVSQDAALYHNALAKGRSLLEVPRRAPARRRRRAVARRRVRRRGRPRTRARVRAIRRPRAVPEEKPAEQGQGRKG